MDGNRHCISLQFGGAERQPTNQYAEKIMDECEFDGICN